MSKVSGAAVWTISRFWTRMHHKSFYQNAPQISQPECCPHPSKTEKRNVGGGWGRLTIMAEWLRLVRQEKITQATLHLGRNVGFEKPLLKHFVRFILHGLPVVKQGSKLAWCAVPVAAYSSCPCTLILRQHSQSMRRSLCICSGTRCYCRYHGLESQGLKWVLLMQQSPELPWAKHQIVGLSRANTAPQVCEAWERAMQESEWRYHASAPTQNAS